MENKMSKKMSKIEAPDVESGKTKNSYNADFKRQIVEVWQNGSYATVADCARSYNINENTLHGWLRNAARNPSVVESNSEIVKLKKELSKTKMELEILKKAAIYLCAVDKLH